MNNNLAAWTRPNSSLENSYQYDAVGNRANYIELWNGTMTAYNYQTGGNRLLNAQTSRGITRNYSYTADGALKSRVVDSSGTVLTSETFSYNTAGLLWKYTSQAQDWRYRYSASGEREQKRNYAGTKTWTYYLLGGDKRQLAVYEGEESEVDPCNDNMLTPPPSRSVYLLPKEYLTYGVGGVSLISTKVADKEYRILDHLGNVRTVISQNIGIKPGIDYEPFGKPLFATPERLTFIGKEKDKESDLGDFGVRKYDDDLGRFLSVDPLWEKFRGWSPYHYSYNNPVRFQDGNGKVPGGDDKPDTPFLDKVKLKPEKQLIDKSEKDKPLPKPWELEKTPEKSKKEETWVKVAKGTSDVGSVTGVAAGMTNELKVAKNFSDKGGPITFWLGLGIDVGLSLTGNQSVEKSVLNTTVGITVMVIGGWSGVGLGAGYFALDKMGAFDGNPKSSYTPSPTVPDATKVEKKP